MSKKYSQYEIKITPMQETSFDDGTWFYFVDIYYHEAPLFTYEYDDPDKIKHLYALRMIENGMDMAAKYADNIIRQDMNGNYFLPKLSDLNPHLANWIESCWQSENDMWFVEHDDPEVDEMTKQDWKEIGEQVEKYFGCDVIEFVEPDEWTPDFDYLVCCYGSCINFVNWL